MAGQNLVKRRKPRLSEEPRISWTNCNIKL